MAKAFGTANRQVEDLRRRAKELGIDPWDILLYFAQGDYKALGYQSPYVTKYTNTGKEYEDLLISPELRQKSAADAAQYIHAKRKAVEMEIESTEEKPKTLIVNLGKAQEPPKELTDAPATNPSV